MSKKLIFAGMLIGSWAGGYVPTLWGTGFLSFSSILWSGIGGLIGIYAGFKLGQRLE